jgi:4'-phosphopantetheinyl transferase
MTYRIFDNMTQCSEQEVARLLHVVSDQRREQALAYKHLFGQYCCLKSYEMLMQLLNPCLYTLHVTPYNFLYNEYGQPRLENGPCFSISHCKHGIAVAVSESAIGIDIEHLRIAKPELVERTMNLQEQEQIWQSENPDWTFTQLWTRKESVLKMKGTGIISMDDIKNTLVSIEHIDLLTKVNIDKQYACTLASRL